MGALEDIMRMTSGTGMARREASEANSSLPAGAPVDPALKGAPRNAVRIAQTGVSPEDRPADTGKAQGQRNYPPGARVLNPTKKPREQMTYTELYDAMYPKPETAEEKEKREKKEKRQAIFAAISDGISALSNLYFTTQYAPNAYDPSKGTSAATKARWDKLRQEREANQRAYAEGYMRAHAMDKAAEREERSWRHGLEREKVADERYEAKAAQDKALADLNEKLKGHQITAAEYKAEQERIAAKFAEDTEKLKQENLKAGVEQKKASAGASRASASASYSRGRYYDNGGSAGGKKFSLNVGGKEYSYESKEDYEKAVERYAKELGVRPYVAYRDGTDQYRKPKYTTKRKSTAQLAAEVEMKSSNNNTTMPGVGGDSGPSTTMPGVI